MDIATVIGQILGTVLVLAAIVEGAGGIAESLFFINVPSLLIVVGGVVAATFTRFLMNDLKGLISICKKSFQMTKGSDTASTIKKFVELSQISRKEGLLALEKIEFDDPFMQKGINYCVDGAETKQIENILMKDIQYMKARHDRAGKILVSMGDMGPAFGMIGTLIGLVNMLTALSDPSALGPAMATALLTTMYGSMIANMFCIPISEKLKIKSGEEVFKMELTVEGIMGLKKGENPRMLEESLVAFLPPGERAAVSSENQEAA